MYACILEFFMIFSKCQSLVAIRGQNRCIALHYLRVRRKSVTPTARQMSMFKSYDPYITHIKLCIQYFFRCAYVEKINDLLNGLILSLCRARVMTFSLNVPITPKMHHTTFKFKNRYLFMKKKLKLVMF